MKKLKVFLAVLCSMLAAVGLFACSKGSGGDGSGETGGQQTEGEAITLITSVRKSKTQFTDAQTWSQVVDAMKDVEFICNTAKTKGVTVKGSQCDFTSNFKFDGEGHCVLGYYTLTAQPKENNPKKLKKDVAVEVVHGWTTSGGSEACSYCGATRIHTEEDTIIHYGPFHDYGSTWEAVPALVYGEDGTNGKAYTNKKAAAGEPTNIAQFGEVADVSEVSYTIPTLTVGRLEPGMTITVKGTARARYGIPGEPPINDWGLEGTKEDKGWFYPVIGIADKYLNNPSFDGGVPRADYTGGGTSVIVRSEGWVLYNGIDSTHGTSNTDTRNFKRMLSGLGAGDTGAKEDRNYGSHELASPDPKVTPPKNFHQGVIPDPKEWTDWIVYSQGTTLASDAYESETEFSLTWNYRQNDLNDPNDDVIELIYNVAGSRLIAMVKVPQATMGYYDTILHGDVVDMYITEYERVETRTPSEFFVEVNNEHKYYEGEKFNPTATLSASFTYVQTGSTKSPQGLSLENMYCSTKENADKDTAADWQPLTTVSKDYKTYMVEVIKGGVHWRKTFAASEITVVPNIIESVAGGDKGEEFKNFNTVGQLAIGTDGTVIKLTPKADVYGQKLSEAQEALFTAASQTLDSSKTYRFVVLNIESKSAPNAALTSVKNAVESGGTIVSGETGVPYLYEVNGTSATLVLAITADTTKVAVEGLQTTLTVVDLTGISGFNVEGTVEQIIDGSADWQINNGSNMVRIVFRAATGHTLTGVYIDNNIIPVDGIKDLESATPKEDFDYSGKFTIHFKGSTASHYEESTGELTLFVSFGAGTVHDYAPHSIVADVDNRRDFDFRIDYIAQLADNDTVESGYYTYVSGGKIYLAKPISGTTYERNLSVSINAGNDACKVVSVNYYVYKDAAILENAEDGVAVSVCEVGDTQFVVVEITPSELGISGSTYGYQLKTDAYSQYYYGVVGGKAVRGTVSGTAEVVKASTCTATGLKAKSVKFNNNNSTFFADIEAVPAHSMVSVSGSVYECSVCHAVYNEGTSASVEIAAAKLPYTQDSGFTVSYFQESATSDWDSNPVYTKYGNVRMGSPALQTNVMSAINAEDTEITALKTKIGGVNLTSGDGNLAEGCGWDTIKLATGVYVTVSVSLTDGISYYMDGSLVTTYAADAAIGEGTVADFVQMFMLCAAKQGLVICGKQFTGNLTAKDAMLLPNSVDEEGAYALYQLYNEVNAHHHVYNAATDKCSCGAMHPSHGYPVMGGLPHNWDNTDHCTLCAALNPKHGNAEAVAAGEARAHDWDENDYCTLCHVRNPVHEHNWENGVCKGCKAPCTHSFGEDVDTCEICGGKIGAVDHTYPASGTGALATWGQTTSVKLYGSNSVVITATYANAGTNTWTGLVVKIDDASGKALYFIRPAGDYASYNGKELVWNVPVAGQGVTPAGWIGDDKTDPHIAFTAAKKTAKTKITITLNEETDTMTVKYEYPETELNAMVWTITGMTDGFYTIGIAYDGASVTNDGVNVKSQSISYNS